MKNLDEINHKCKELRVYINKVMDLYCDSVKWGMISETSEDEIEKARCLEISHNLKRMFLKEINKIKED